jgi:hypothetical protein
MSARRPWSIFYFLLDISRDIITMQGTRKLVSSGEIAFPFLIFVNGLRFFFGVGSTFQRFWYSSPSFH